MAESRCPMCGKPNPEGVEECQHCGARLKPLLASTPPEESRPLTPPDPPEPAEPIETAAPQDEGDDWLDDLREEVVKGTDDLALTGALDPTRLERPPERKPPPKPGEEGTPEWLQRLRKKRADQSEGPEPVIEASSASEELPIPPSDPEGEKPTWLEHFREADEQDVDVSDPPTPAPPPALCRKPARAAGCGRTGRRTLRNPNPPLNRRFPNLMKCLPRL